MAYDEALASRVRNILSSRQNLEERILFGGPQFSINGNMVCSINSQGFTLRTGDKTAEVLQMPNMKPKMLGAKQMNGVVIAEPAAYESDEDLAKMVNMAADIAAALPPKEKKEEKAA